VKYLPLVVYVQFQLVTVFIGGVAGPKKQKTAKLGHLILLSRVTY
jgi:hypothetical protein